MSCALDLPFFVRLRAARRVLVVGAGGGFDVFAGLPLRDSLRDAGAQVHLANLSFSELAACDGERLGDALWRIDADTGGNPAYFPEARLAEWLASCGQEHDVFALVPTGVAPLRAAYEQLVAKLGIDAIVLVDGGTDILMRGDEQGLGSPVEDIANLTAVAGLELTTTFVSCLGFGVDRHHGVDDAQCLENVAALSAAGGFLGAHSLHLCQAEVARYRDAVLLANRRTPQRPSIVGDCVVAALEGRFGDRHASTRTKGSELFVNPLMTFYWHFDLRAVAQANLYLSSLEGTTSAQEVALRIEAFRQQVELRPRARFPG